MKPSYVVSLSGGKDSTAMLLMMLERGENIVAIVYFDTGWEFPQMDAHLRELERYVGREIVRLRPRDSFDYLFSKRARTRNKANPSLGYGWPSMARRWCTREKIRAIGAYCNAFFWQGYELPITQCIGYALDEPERIEEHRKDNKITAYQSFTYPLADWGVTEADALAICKRAGFEWSGLYDHFDRVSCFCCPLKSLPELRTLRRHFPDLWTRMLEMESWLPEKSMGRRFKDRTTVSDLDARFAADDIHESRMLKLPGMAIGASL